MKPIDVAGLNIGIVCLGLATLGLITAFGTVDWPLMSIVAPIGLVVIGLTGILLSRASTKGRR